MTAGQRKKMRQAQAAHARAARAAKRARQDGAHGTEATNGNGLLSLGLERREARFLYDLLEGMGHDTALKLRHQILDLAFTH